MSLQPATYEQAKAAFKPLRRPRIEKRADSSSLGRKASPARRKAPKTKRKKRLTTGQLKKRAWTEFSIYIRSRGADSEGFNLCVTCQQRYFWKDLQAGHFIRGRLNANLFDERGCQPQCHRCNIHFQGNVVVYYKWMLEHYGQEVIDGLMRQNDQTHKWLPGELESIWQKYKDLNSQNPLLREN